MRQSVITCTAATRPASPNEGMLILETDTNIFLTYDGANWIDLSDRVGGAWINYTPVNAGTGWTFGAVTTLGRFKRVGRVVVVQLKWSWAAGVSVGSQGMRTSLPVNCDTTDYILAVDNGVMFDQSASRLYFFTGIVGEAGTDSVSLYGGTPAIANNLAYTALNSTGTSGGLAVPTDSGDFWQLDFVYRAAL
jgi:hypothetical protein